jgi:ATP-dependent helicase/nuclease subunit A
MTIVRTDDAARRLIANELDSTLVVEAAAGTGKTTELVNRILAVLGSGRAKVDEIVAVTFTEKAAGELKLRLRQKLEEARRAAGEASVRARLDEAVRSLEEAHVSTIHGFCADLLRERPVEARVDPLFRVLTEGQAERLFEEAFAGWFYEHLENPPEGMRRSLRRGSRTSRPGDADEDGPIDRLRRAGFNLTEWRDFPCAWTREPFDRAARIAELTVLVRTLADVSQKPSYVADNLFLDTDPVRRLAREIKSRGDGFDHDELEGLFIDLRRNRDFKRMRKGSGPTYSKGVPRQRVLDARTALVQALDEFQLRADADLAALLHDELLGCVDRYEKLKMREGALDFLDLLLRARDLVRDDLSVRRHFQRRFRRLFVDEFQDTDPLQGELLLLLAADDPVETRWEHVTPVPGKLFVVGDPKQSIYRFRRADVDVYRRVCERLIACGATKVELQTSFRSVPNLQRAVNAAFRPVMNGDRDAMQADYVALAPARDEHPAQPSVVALPVPKPYAMRYVAARAIEESLPDASGAFVDWLVNQSGWTVTERRDPGRRVPIEARHICILFRRFVSYGEDITRKYVEALEARGIRHLLVGGRAFHDRDEIETLRAALMAVEWPDDQLSIFATLRGSLFALGDEELLEYYDRARTFHPFRIATGLPSHLDAVAEALTFLRELHVQRNRRPVAETISTLLDRTRAHVGFVLRPGGEQVLANVLHVAELARQYELDGGMSFRGFVDTLHTVSAGGQTTEAPILEEGSDGVRLMTVHKAKGLEFPVVILADITAKLTPFEASRHIDPDRKLCALRIGGWSPIDLVHQQALELVREQREGERVAYVAATRARDLLVVPAVGDAPYEGGWIGPLNAVIYPAEDARRAPEPARGCPPFASKDSVLWRPDGDPATKLTVCPGGHTFVSPNESWSVAWWAPDALSLDVQAPFGLRRDDLIVKDVPPAVLKGHLDAYRTWRAERDAAVARAAVASVHVMTATEAAIAGGIALQGCEDIEVTVETVPGAASRPGGARFGSLVHALLAHMPLENGSGDACVPLAEAHGRVLGAAEDEVAAAQDAASRVLAHPIIRRAAVSAAAGRCRREAPVTLRLDSGAIVEGFVDLVFEDDGRFVVVDFKTDRELEGAIEQYRRQVQIYAHAVRVATGKSARAILMRV